jgi:hypothetical protein
VVRPQGRSIGLGVEDVKNFARGVLEDQVGTMWASFQTVEKHFPSLGLAHLKRGSNGDVTVERAHRLGEPSCRPEGDCQHAGTDRTESDHRGCLLVPGRGTKAPWRSNVDPRHRRTALFGIFSLCFARLTIDSLAILP